ncbi:MAG TPA: class I SAM-dependent methyltransferase [Bryobacteraceae bacterium]|nr:class I SAM-dependent methyltransferase [Bryobacteraceae bacterium]
MGVQTSALRSALAGVWLLVSVCAAQPSKQPLHAPDVPYLPTTEPAVQAMLKLAGVKSGDIVYDLGCGDGRIVVAAAKDFGARAVGIDINPERIAEARANAKRAGVENRVRFEEGDLFTADIHEATVVTLFLLSSVNQRLRPKLQAELQPGARIVSNTFDMGDWKPDKEATVETADDSAYFSRKLYLWTIPHSK